MKTSDRKTQSSNRMSWKTLQTKAKMSAARSRAISSLAVRLVQSWRKIKAAKALPQMRAASSGVKQMHAMNRRLANQGHDDEHHRQKNGARRKRGIHRKAQQPVCHCRKDTCQKFVDVL